MSIVGKAFGEQSLFVFLMLIYKAIHLGGSCCPLISCVIHSLTACMKQHPLILEALMYLYLAVLRFLFKRGQFSVAVDNKVWEMQILFTLGHFFQWLWEPKETVGVGVRCKCTTQPESTVSIYVFPPAAGGFVIDKLIIENVISCMF